MERENTGANTDRSGRTAIRVLLLNVAAPLATYALLTRLGLPTVTALVTATVFPLSAIVLTVARTRRIDVIGALSLAAIMVAIVGGLIFDDPHVLLAKESIVTGLLGLLCLGSVVMGRPFVFVLASRFDSRLGRDVMDRLRTSAVLRASGRRLTLAWGVGLLADASARVILSFLVTPGVLLVISPLVAAAVLGPLGVWTIREVRGWGQLRRSAAMVGRSR